MRKWIPAVLLLLALPAVAAAQRIDPLSAALSPKIDKNPSHYASNIWITGPLEKVRQDSGQPGMVHWAIVYATQNEIQSFQVHVKAPAGGIQRLNVTVSDLVQTAPSHYAISASSTDIVIYREYYEHVSPSVSSTGFAFYGETGYYPDILVPKIDPYYKQTTNAFPASISGGNNQSFWVDVHIPKSAPSGWYLGHVTVAYDKTTVATLPVLYGVWQWPASSGGYMPSKATLGFSSANGGFGYGDLCFQEYGSGNCGNYPGAEGNTNTGIAYAIADAETLLLDNRMSMDYDAILTDTGNFSFYNAVEGPNNNGTNGRIKQILRGAQRTVGQIGCAGGCAFNETTARIFANWVRDFSREGWISSLTYYLADEPGESAWTTINRNGPASRSYSSPNVPMVATTDWANVSSNSAENSIDWIVVAVQCMEPGIAYVCYSNQKPLPNQRSTYDKWLSGNCCNGTGPKRELGSYLACGSSGTCSNGIVGSLSYPNYDVDAYPVANRIQEWDAYRNGLGYDGIPLRTELYYYFTQSFRSYSPTTNAWQGVYAYGNWGDGDLLYPGTTAMVGTRYPIWIPSMRIKYIRDGMQDYEYMNLLYNKGRGAFVSNEIATFIANMYTYNPETIPARGFKGDLPDARYALGEEVHHLTYPKSP